MRKPRGNAADRSQDLKPLDLEGTDFEELLDASTNKRTRRAPEPVDEDDDGDRADRYAELRPSAKATPRDTSRDLAARFGAPAQPEATPATADATPARTPATPAAPEITAPWLVPPQELSTSDEPDDEGVENTRDETLVGAFALGLVLMGAFLPWYVQDGLEVKGMSSGGLAVVPFVMGVAALLTVILRRVGVKVRFPVARSLMLEVFGYVAVFATIAGRFVKPGGGSTGLDGFDLLGIRINTSILTVVVSMGLVWFASRMSHGAPVIMRPGWFQGKEGRVGAALIAAVVLIGGGLAMVKPGSPFTGSLGAPGLDYSDSPPPCFTDDDFPIPPVLKVRDPGYFQYPMANGMFCGVTFESKLPIKSVHQKMVNQLRRSGWKFDVAGRVAAGTTTFQLETPACGSVIILDQSGTPDVDYPTTLSVQIQPCVGLGDAPPPTG